MRGRSPAASLTTTERAVLAVLARGASVVEAAETLGWSGREVSTELVSASCKLGARSGQEALLIAVRRGDIRRSALGWRAAAREGSMAPDVLAALAFTVAAVGLIRIPVGLSL